MQTLKLDRIREWYQTRLGIVIPKTKLIDIFSQYIPEGMESGFFLVPPIRSWDEIHGDSFQASKQSALKLLHNDPDFSGISHNRLKSQFERLVVEEIENYQGKVKSSQQLKEYTEQEGGERVYVFPGYRRLAEEGVKNEGQVIVDSLLAHELLHGEQERRGLNARFPNIKEGPAWVLQFLYGADHLELGDYVKQLQKLSQRLNPTQNYSTREQQYATNVNIGIEVVTQRLGIDLNGNSKEQLEKFRSIFEMPRYGQLETEVIYRHFKPKLQERLR